MRLAVIWRWNVLQWLECAMLACDLVSISFADYAQ